MTEESKDPAHLKAQQSIKKVTFFLLVCSIASLIIGSVTADQSFVNIGLVGFVMLTLRPFYHFIEALDTLDMEKRHRIHAQAEAISAEQAKKAKVV